MRKFTYSMILMVVLAVTLRMPVFTAHAANEVIDLNASYTGKLTDDNKKNYYEFTLTESGRVRVNVTTTMGNTYYEIYDSNNVKVWGGTYSNGVDQKVNLVAGTYSFYVGKYSYTGSYSFKLTFDSAKESFPESVGNTKNSMGEAPTTVLGESYNGQLASNDKQDCYKFTLSESGKIRVNVTTTMGNTYYEIYNSSDVKVWGGTYSNGVDQKVDLVAGTYYFYVREYSYTGSYSFKLTFDSAKESFPESVGNTQNSMDEAPTIVLGKNYNGQLASNDKQDCYKFTLFESGKIHVNVTTTMGNTYYEIYDSSDVKVWGGTYSNGVDQKVDLVAGTYYFYVREYSYTGSYSFKLTFDSADESFLESVGNTQNSMDEAPTIVLWESYNGQLASNDKEDYYKFTLFESGKIRVEVTTTMGYTYYRIYNSSDVKVWDGSQSNGVDKEVDLKAGTYYFYVGKASYTGNYSFIISGDMPNPDITSENHTCAGIWITTIDATCTQSGTKEYICSICTKILKVQSIPAMGHDYDEWIIYSEATCSTEGLKCSFCTACGEDLYESIPKLAHTLTEWSITKSPTCYSDGVQTRSCIVCDHTETQKLPSLPHMYGNWNIVKNASCGQPGSEERVCSLCGKKESREIPALKHTYGNWKVVTQATCGKPGKEERVCSLCGNKESREISATTKHQYGDWKVVTQATCSKPGKEERVCSVCGNKESREISTSTKHQYGDWKVVTQATCSKSGKEERACTLCGRKESREISTLKHTYGDWQVVTQATCGKPGSEERICSSCGNKEIAEIPALEHQYEDWKVVVLAQCNQPGKEERVCTLCGDKESKEIPISLEHTYGDWKIVTPAGCDKTGTQERVCASCGTIETQTMEALMHQYGEYEIISGNKLIPPIIKEHKCSICGNLERVSDWGYIWVTILTGILTGIATVGVFIGIIGYIRAFRKR